MSKRRKERLSASEVSAFCEQMALLLKGGIPVYESTYILYQENERKEEKKSLKEIAALVKDSMPFHEALRKSELFPEYMIHMVKIGEATGQLAFVMDSLAAYYEREEKVMDNVRHVAVYPLILFTILGGILLILVIKILPIFKKVFYGLDSSGSKASELMLEISMKLGRGVAVVVVLMIVTMVLALLLNKTEAGNAWLKKIGNYIPYIEKVNYKLGTAKFVSALSIMIGSGLRNEKSLELASELVEHPVLKKRIYHCLRSIRNNGTLADSLRDSKLITGMNGRMIGIGAKTGAFDIVFKKIQKNCDDEAEQSLHGITSAVETILVVALSVVMGAVLIAIMLPLISIISTIG